MNFLLDVNNIDITKPIENATDKLLYGGQILLIGMATVFSILFLLWFTLVIFKLFFHDLGGKKKKVKEVSAAPAPTPSMAPVSADEEIVAVIAAAIAMAESESGNGVKFRVVSFKRK